ncbi:MAG: hypothetical protein RPR98_00775 [Bermanella sp.]|jgi:hypothetical protein
MFKPFLLLLLAATFITACTIYYQPHGKRGGGVVIKVPEEPKVKPMPDVDKKPAQKTKSGTTQTKGNS